jgi:hypothetical protein
MRGRLPLGSADRRQIEPGLHMGKPCREKAWADYHAELTAISSEDGLNPHSPEKAAILSAFDAILR